MKRHIDGYIDWEMIGGFFFFVGIAVVIFYAVTGVNLSPGSGQQIGQIALVEKRGLFYDTWEAELIPGYGNISTGQKRFKFTIPQDSAAQKAMEYMQTKTVVVIQYNRPGFYLPQHTESRGRYLITMEPAKDK